MEVAVVDLGGTHARFALARGEASPPELTHMLTLETAEHAGLQAAWRIFVDGLPGPPPRQAAIAVAGPVGGEEVRMTNAAWTFRPADLASELGLERSLVLNDFAAIGHAVGAYGRAISRRVLGPDGPPSPGVVTVLGPGTGLGVAHVRRGEGGYAVTETEGGHVGFAPADEADELVLRHLRRLHGRVSAERVVSGPGLRAIHDALAAHDGRPAAQGSDAELWTAALEGSEVRLAAALERFLRRLGAVAGDLALAQGAVEVVVAGGLGLRLADRLAGPAFAEGFRAKGRFTGRMAATPVRVVVHPQPGLIGAAASLRG